jgi:kynureninase
MPKKAPEYINEECEAWAKYGVEGHFKSKVPWVSYHETLTEQMANLVGAKKSEVVVMNTLTVNLHLMMVSFYRPTTKRFKILIEPNAFPSDQYAVDSQAKFHGFDPDQAIVELSPREGEETMRPQDILDKIEAVGDELALVMLGNVNYLTGQCYDFQAISEKAHEKGALVGFNLAHGAGNLLLNLHDWNVDFAVWCSYKYLNSGPGGLAGCFVHEKHHKDAAIPRFEGWWGHDKKRRFLMERTFAPIGSAESWQLSNPPIFQLASLRASMDLFEKATMKALRKKGDELTSYLQFLLQEKCRDECFVVTPEKNRGSMLCLKIRKGPKELGESLSAKGAIFDFREPDIFRVTPAPLYNSFQDVYQLVQIFEDVL